MQRGREHGLPSYNALRRQLGLAPRLSFAEISADPEVQAALSSVYGEVEAIDLWTGALAEDRLPGSLVGELVFVVLKRQFELLRDGDRYWYQIELDGLELAEVESTRLSDVIRRNTGIRAEIPDAAFAPFEASLAGSLPLNVTIHQPLVDPALPSSIGDEGALAVSGYSFPGQTVELLANGAVIATTTAAEDGSYSFQVVLEGGSYEIQTQAQACSSESTGRS